ncbi:MAG: hypothetical protein Q8R28_07910 [Dehalococcoidia bacterium]|nr:hypothetical protein [Dehalococcoidia bacterium]
MAVIFGEQQPDGLYRVSAIWYRETELPPDTRDAFLVDAAKIPDWRADEPGSSFVMLFDPATESFSFEAVVRQKNVEERLTALETDVAALKGSG